MYRIILLICGSVALLLGFIGIFLPILPTTPLILVAAACFAKSSKTAYNWLITNKYFGSVVLDWEKNRTMPLKAKIVSIVLLNVSLIVSGLFFSSNIMILLALIIIGILVSLYIIRIPTSSSTIK